MATLFCDLDGVLVDFEQGFHNNFGFHPDSVPEPEMWDYIVGRNRHWHDLPPMPDAMKLWDYIKQFNPIILTGCPRTGYDHADEGKREWCKRILGYRTHVITCRSRNKPQHMLKPGDILIDDLTKNCKRWEEHGGTGILHTSASDTIQKLKGLGF